MNIHLIGNMCLATIITCFIDWHAKYAGQPMTRAEYNILLGIFTVMFCAGSILGELKKGRL